MCDYSLHAHPNRLAHEGEELVLARFTGGSKGFACVADVRKRQQMQQGRPKFSFSWAGVCAYWKNRRVEQPLPPMTAVCVPPGAKLTLEGIPLSLQHWLGVSHTEEVTFTQIGCEAYVYRDAVRFSNGRQLLLQRLFEGQIAKVVSLTGDPAPQGTEVPVSTPLELNPA